jgi:predicted dehydrogenase
MVRVAILGCAHIHTPRFAEMLQARADVRVTHVWDDDLTRAAKVATALGSVPVRDLDSVLGDPKLSGVIVLCETDRHEALVLQAAGARKHLFVEKPLGLGGGDARRMADAIEAAGLLFQTGYFLRGRPAHRFLKEQLAQGAFGTVTRARFTLVHGGALQGMFDHEWRWMADPARAGVGGFGDLGTHALDLLVWLLGEVEAVAAYTSSVTGRYPGCDEFGEDLLRFKSGAYGSLAAGWVDVANPVTLELYGTEGCAYLADGRLYVKSEHLDGADGKAPWHDLPEALPHALELFLDALSGTSVALVGASEAAYRVAVMEALYRSAKERAWLVL